MQTFDQDRRIAINNCAEALKTQDRAGYGVKMLGIQLEVIVSMHRNNVWEETQEKFDQEYESKLKELMEAKKQLNLCVENVREYYRAAKNLGLLLPQPGRFGQLDHCQLPQ